MGTYAKFSVQSRDQLKKYIRMKLGYPIISLEITDEQMEFAIDEALEEYSKWVHYDEGFYRLDFTKVTEISKDNKTGSYDPKLGFKLPDCIVSVNRIHESPNAIFSNTGDSMDFLLANSGMYPMMPYSSMNNMFAGGEFLSLYLFQNYVKQWREPFGYRFNYNYNERSKFLKLDPDPMIKRTGPRGVVLEVQTIRPEDQLYGEDLVKRLALALVKQMIGQVRAKFGSGISFPGGGQVGADILSEGKEEFDKIMEELQKTEPPFMYFLQM